MSTATKAMLSSWFNAFMAAVITAAIALFAAAGGNVPTSGSAWLGVLVAGIVAVLPVIKNYFSTSYTLYGKVSE